MNGRKKKEFETRCIDTIRLLSADAVQKANSGHPGMPMGAAAMAFTLFTRFLRFDPKDPRWPGRDRFILSAGHGSMLLYCLLSLSGYALTIDDLKKFRQWKSKTPGHPEYGVTPGVEMTTGPLGQGFATGVGIALGLKHLAARYNKNNHAIIGERVFGIASDGDLMEGISSEAASLAGHLGLSNLVYLYDDNRISIEGDTAITFTEDVGEKFRALGWLVLTVSDGNSTKDIAKALKKAIDEKERPSLVMVRTEIGYGSPTKQGSESAHGAPLGEEELARTKQNLGWPAEPTFLVPADVRDFFKKMEKQKAEEARAWHQVMKQYEKRYPKEAKEIRDIYSGKLPRGWEKKIPTTFPTDKKLATRAASGKVLNHLAPVLTGLIGGSADLAPSNNTYLKDIPEIQRKRYGGRNIRFGVREHAMGAILNGLSLVGLIPYGGTFLVFADYMRPAIRLSALMGLGVIYIFTHDSIGLGEDGPTHQPIEQLASLRAIPNLVVIRPADAAETAAAWEIAVKNRTGPTALILSRQGLAVLDRSNYPPAAYIKQGAYVLSEPKSKRKPDLILIGSGAEVHRALEAQEILEGEGVAVRVVNMASFELFDAQTESYRREVLPDGVKKMSIEAASPFGWERYVGTDGVTLGIDRFGASAPGDVLFEKFGFSPRDIARRAKELINP
jgi:transketolase